MKKYRFKKVLLVIACFSLVVVMTACGSGSSGGGSHASISTDPDNPSELTFPETNEDGDIFYQSIYNSTVDDPDAEPGTIYGCYQGTSTDGDIIAFVASKPQLSDTITQKLDENGLKYFVISAIQGEIDDANSYDQIYIFKDEASYDAISRDQKTIKVVGRYIGISLGTEDNYSEAGSGCINEDFSVYEASNEEFVLGIIDYLISH
ncbi:hypothetical protein [Alterileibacterium massiliense]|uniref:hypothetical protein n=1 Tax=Alterileibacterium massiliense TaxID=1870997 RepID=UPI0008D92457|nr:hypothetical protein [Alterileibacterium massiliense]